MTPRYDAWEVVAREDELFVAKAIAAGVTVGTSVTRFGYHSLPLADTPESAQELVTTWLWLKARLSL